MSKKKSPPSRPISDPYLINNYTSWLTPHEAPDIEHYDTPPLLCLIFSEKLLPHLLGLLETIKWTDKWLGSQADRERMVGVVTELMEALIGGNCMVDPCCPETNEILTEIKVLNQTIVNNMVTMINNQTTIIEDNDTIISNQEIISNYTWQQVINQGNQYNTYLEILDDGETPQSFAPGVSENFSIDNLSEAQLCKAIENYINAACENMRAFLTLLGILSVAAAGLAIVALVLTGGTAAALAPYVGVALGALNAAALALLGQAINDEDAKRRVRCCMFDSLKGQAINKANFEASVNDCGFDNSPSGEPLAAQLAASINDINHKAGSYRAFVVELKTIQQNAQAVSVSPCECGCEDDIELVPYLVAATQIIPMGNCVYRIIQNTVPDTAHPTWYRAGFKDLLDRPIKVDYPPEGYNLQGQGGSTVTGACGQPNYDGDNYGGGFVPFASLANVNWWSGEPVDTYLKITLVPPEECP